MYIILNELCAECSLSSHHIEKCISECRITVFSGGEDDLCRLLPFHLISRTSNNSWVSITVPEKFLNPWAKLNLVAQLSFSNTSFSFSFISKRSNLDNLKLNTRYLLFSFTVSLKKGLQSPSSWCNWFLILSSSSDSRTSLRFLLNVSQLLSMFHAFSSYAVEEIGNTGTLPSKQYRLYWA